MSCIWAFCKDPGGTSNLLPILPLLRSAGHKIELFLHEGGRGQSVIKTAQEKFTAVSSCEGLLGRKTAPDLVITTMCSGGGVGRDIIPASRDRGIPTVALQDFWGGRLNTDFAEIMYHPELICVNDQLGADVVRKTWGDRSCIAITGYPSLDTILHSSQGVRSGVGREILGIRDDLPIVFYPGQIWHAGRTLSDLVDALESLGIPCHLIVTKHGRMMREAPEEDTLWQEAERRFQRGIWTVTDFQHIKEVMAASRVVVGMYSSLQIEAAVMGVQVISILYPDLGAALFAQETGGVMEDFPLVTLGCSAKAVEDQSLKDLLQTALVGDLDLEDHQRAVFKLDGRNAHRVVEVVTDLL